MSRHGPLAKASVNQILLILIIQLTLCKWSQNECRDKSWFGRIGFTVEAFEPQQFIHPMITTLRNPFLLTKRKNFVNNPYPALCNLNSKYHLRPRVPSSSSSSLYVNDSECDENTKREFGFSRRKHVSLSLAWMISSVGFAPQKALAIEEEKGVATAVEEEKVLVVLSGETKQLFNEGLAKEMQGNIAAAYRIYSKVTNIVPKFIYGWSNLGNTQVVIGKLDDAEVSYSNAIDLCKENLDKVGDQFGVRRCEDLYLLYLNRGSLRLNNNMKQDALKDLDLSATLRGKPDAIILQNRARARELNSMYGPADRDYDVAISMTSNEVSPFWLRAAMVKFQLGNTLGAMDLLRRVEIKFPEAPEVRAARAAMLWNKGDEAGAKRKFLEIPDKQRFNFGNEEYLKGTVAWPPSMINSIREVAVSIGDP